MLTSDALLDLHDKVLRGDGQELGLVALVTNLCIKTDLLEKTVHELELTVAKAKGWIIGATAVGTFSGILLTFVFEHFVFGKK